MRKTLVVFCFLLAARSAPAANEADARLSESGPSGVPPTIVRSWIVNPAAMAPGNPSLLAVLPDVHSVRVDQKFVYVQSAGLSLQSLVPLQVNDRAPRAEVQKFVYRFPLRAEKSNARVPVPTDVIGAFVNGVPIYNPASPVSWSDQNLWHLDSVRQAGAPSPVVASLLSTADRHSPLIGFALDGFPVYGPYGWDDAGVVKRFCSSYRLRSITARATLPNGVELTPSQEGPAISPDYPLGTFAEDYEFVSGSGDLDEHNGRFARTPEYPQGTYAYFLSTDARGQMEFPYLVGRSYYGDVEDLRASPDRKKAIEFTARDLIAGQPSTLTFVIRGRDGLPIPYLENTHEQPIHLAIVSADLSEFAHIHPQLQANGSWTVTHNFPHGGRFSIFADYTRPGEPPSISSFEVNVAGAAKAAAELRPDRERTKVADGLRISLHAPARIAANQDITFRFDVTDTATGLPVYDLEPYLGAWAHIMVVSADRTAFIHAHPVDDAVVAANPWQHTHAAPGPSPSTVTTIAGFRRPGVYRLWIQLQRYGRVVTVPFTLEALPAVTPTHSPAAIPTDAIRVNVSSAGFVPARITAPVGKPARLAFLRQDAQNCASSVVFPEFGIRKELPPGRAVLVEIPAAEARELHFTCGMNMFRGSLVIR